MMMCTNCGATSAATDIFCEQCGARLPDAAKTPPEHQEHPTTAPTAGAPAKGPTQPSAAPQAGAPGPFAAGAFLASSSRYATSSKGFLASLLDPKVESFITPKLIRVMYLLSGLLLAAVAFMIVVFGFREDFLTGLISLFVFAPAFLLFNLIAVRLWLELVAVLFMVQDAARQVAANTSKLVDRDDHLRGA